MEIRVDDSGVQREDAGGAIAAFVRGGFDEGVNGCVELEGQRFDVIAELVPRREPVLAREHRLRIMQGACLARLEKLLRLAFELVEVGTGGKLLGCHKASVLNAGGPQAGQQGDNRAVIRSVGWTQSFARTRVRPVRAGTMASGGLGVKRRRARTPLPFAPDPPTPRERPRQTRARPRGPWSARSSCVRRRAPVRVGSGSRSPRRTDTRTPAGNPARRQERARWCA